MTSFTMANYGRRQFEERLTNLKDDMPVLDGDVERLTEALQLHHDHKRKEQSTVRGMLKKEIGGSVWEHGAQGKLRDYSSLKYAEKSNKYPPKPIAERSTSKASKKYSKSKSATTSTRINSRNSSRTAVNGSSSVSTMEPSVSKIKSHKTDITRIGLSPNKSPPKPAPGGDGSNPNQSNGHRNDGLPENGENDIQELASRFSGMRVSLNETYTKEIHGESPYKLPIAPDRENNVIGESPGTTPEKRAKMLKKMIKKLDIDMKLGEYRTSETDSDSLSTPRHRSITSPQPGRYCHPDVLAWLMNLGLKDTERVAKIFAEKEMDMDSLAKLSESELCQMGITALGTLSKLSRAIEDLVKKSSDKRAHQRSHSAHLSSLPPSQANLKKHELAQNQPQEFALNMSESDKKQLYQPYQRTFTKQQGVSDRCHAPAQSKANHIADSSRKRSKSAGAKSTAASTSGANSKNIPGSSSVKSIKSSNLPAKECASGVTKTRPASAVTHSKAPSKVRSAFRPASAHAERINQNPSSHSPERSTESNVTASKISDQKKAALSSLISVRPLATSRAPAARHRSSEQPGTYDGDHMAALHDEPEARLQFVEQQISDLQKDLTGPAAMEIIKTLQDQLIQIQAEVLAKKQSLNNQASQAQTTPHSVSKSVRNSKNDNPNAVKTGASAKSPHSDLTGSDVPKVKSLDIEADPGRGTMSMSMSKTALLREVRKERDVHRKHIRHLESELSRLKHKDPIRNCEIPEEDIQFDQQYLLGEGAFSQVYKGSYQGSDVAVKRLKVPLSYQDKNYFSAEVSLLKELRHPRVVLLLGVCTSAQHALMVLEYMSQGALYHYLHRHNVGPFDHAAYYQIAKDISLGMNYLHRHNPVVLHLDLKSMNVLLNTHLRAKIADFGFSKLRHDADQMMSKKVKGQTKGTPAWMAPELLNTGDMSTKSDVYSFSIILWEMLTRRHPYQGCSMFQVIEKTRTNKRLEIPTYCPPGLRDLIARCWNQNPARRPSFKDILSVLDRLQLPGEWRSLFAKAGIPKAALEDVESTRTLIDIVTLTLEDVPKRPDDVPVLDLVDSDDDKVMVDYDDSDDDTFDSDDDWEDVTEDDEDSEVGHRRWNDERPSDMPLLDLQLSGNSGTNKTMKAQTFRKQSPDGVLKNIEDGSDLPEMVQSLKPPSYIPPPPPPQKNPTFCQPPPPHKAPAPDLIKHTPPKHKFDVRFSFLEQLQSALEERPSVSDFDRQVEDALLLQGPKKAGVLDLRASQLLSQKKKLRSVEDPHPCQLGDLSQVPLHTMNDLFGILKKAVESRRMYIHDDSVELEDTQSAAWTLTER